MNKVPDIRVRKGNDHPVRADGHYVLYWMVATRRPHWNFSLDHAVHLAKALDRPLMVLETLRCDYRWASARIHRFMLQGMAAHAAHFAEHGIAYYPYVEPERGCYEQVLEAFAAEAAVVVSDDWPCFCVPQMLATAGRGCRVRLDLVDSNGLLPLRATTRSFTTAASFRRYLQKALPDYLQDAPSSQPLRARARLEGARLPRGVAARWPRASKAVLAAGPAALAALPIDQDVGPVDTEGGYLAADHLGRQFVRERLTTYADDRNHPDRHGGSGLSPYLHFGMLSVHMLLAELASRDDWAVTDVAERATGSREGWWHMSAAAESFLDEVITWRELGQNRCAVDPEGYDRYETLPEWAKQTLQDHEGDPRPKLYTRAQLEAAETHDPVWNAAQREIVQTGSLHNYMRMLWGKKVLEWSKTPQQAAEVLIELNNRWGLDGRDPNSYAGIFWVFGRYDRAWGPERPIFGKVRYMTSDSTRRKLKMKAYLERFAAPRAR